MDTFSCSDANAETLMSELETTDCESVVRRFEPDPGLLAIAPAEILPRRVELLIPQRQRGVEDFSEQEG